VPKAAVKEEGEFELRKGEIGVAEEGVVAPPAGDVELAKEGDQAEFGGFVAGRPHPGHEETPLFLCKEISHLDLNPLRFAS
jgi:hypothetical protein